MSDSDDTPLPAGWNRGYSNSQKRTYYFHAATKHTQWHFPTASEVADPNKAKKRSELNKAQEKRKADGTSLGSIVTKVGDITSSLQPKATTATAASSNSSSKRARTNESDRDLLAFADSTSIAVIVPYRDIHIAQKRAAHLKAFLPHMHQFFAKLKAKTSISDYHIYIVEQSDDGRKFNRGKLLNIGFDYARKNHTTGGGTKHKGGKEPIMTQRTTTPLKHDVFIFHDVDLLPDDNLASWYAEFPKVPIHIARVWDRYSNNPKYFGGVVSFSESDYKRINGYPNTFWYVRLRYRRTAHRHVVGIWKGGA
jgi:N-terminal region of glycosyl transferase group 7/N-terminal domain of galactosyltransferase/WW domain